MHQLLQNVHTGLQLIHFEIKSDKVWGRKKKTDQVTSREEEREKKKKGKKNQNVYGEENRSHLGGGGRECKTEFHETHT